MNKVEHAAFKRAMEYGWDEEMAPKSLDQEIEESELVEDEVKLMWAIFDALCEQHSINEELVNRLNKEIDFFWNTVGSALPEHKDSPYSLKNR